MLRYVARRRGLPTVIEMVHPPAEHGSSSLSTCLSFPLMEARMCEGEGRRGRSGPDLQSEHGPNLCWDTDKRELSLIPQFSHRLLWIIKQCCSMLSRGQFSDTNEKIFGEQLPWGRGDIQNYYYIT